MLALIKNPHKRRLEFIPRTDAKSRFSISLKVNEWMKGWTVYLESGMVGGREYSGVWLGAGAKQTGPLTKYSTPAPATKGGNKGLFILTICRVVLCMH